MSGSAELHKRLKDPYAVAVPKRGYLDDWANNYMVNGACGECHPDFIATPIGDSPYGFLVCQRKVDISGNPPEAQRNRKRDINTGNFVPYNKLETNSGNFYSQTFDLYNNIPNSKPRYTFLGGQPLALEDRRMPFEATNRSNDYFKECTKYKGIGQIEHIDRRPGSYGYEENKYYYSGPPPRYDITQGVQPYNMWERQQVFMGTFSNKEEVDNFNKISTFRIDNAPTF